MVSRVIPVDPFDLVIFGATGDLARRKILPGLFRRFVDGQMPPEARIIGAARTDQDSAAWADQVVEAVETFLPKARRDAEMLTAFRERLRYIPVDAMGDGGWADLRAEIRDNVVQAFYFSVAPGLFGALAERLHSFKIARQDARIVVEKPFGRDLASARDLNRTLAEHFDETQIYRIDHYLGKETVQNLMAVRFGNTLFEPLWNAQYVDHVQITVAEEVGVEATVFDLATLAPLDTDAIAESVRRTGRLVVVHEAPQTYGPAAEIAQRVAEAAFLHLEAPVRRVAGWDTMVPYFAREQNYMPDAARILDGARACLSY